MQYRYYLLLLCAAFLCAEGIFRTSGVFDKLASKVVSKGAAVFPSGGRALSSSDEEEWMDDFDCTFEWEEGFELSTECGVMLHTMFEGNTSSELFYCDNEDWDDMMNYFLTSDQQATCSSEFESAGLATYFDCVFGYYHEQDWFHQWCSHLRNMVTTCSLDPPFIETQFYCADMFADCPEEWEDCWEDYEDDEMNEDNQEGVDFCDEISTEDIMEIMYEYSGSDISGMRNNCSTKWDRQECLLQKAIESTCESLTSWGSAEAYYQGVCVTGASDTFTFYQECALYTDECLELSPSTECTWDPSNYEDFEWSGLDTADWEENFCGETTGNIAKLMYGFTDTMISDLQSSCPDAWDYYDCGYQAALEIAGCTQDDGNLLSNSGYTSWSFLILFSSFCIAVQVSSNFFLSSILYT